MRSLLCTGGAGFIGANLVRHLLAATDLRVTVLDALTYAGNRASLTGLDPDRLTFVHGDVRDGALVDSLVADHDAVLHLAAESHNDNALRDPFPAIDTNILGTFRVLEAVRRYDKRLHHVTTDEVYGDLAPEAPPITERAPYRPSSPYAAAKASADMLVRAWVRSYGVRATISGCSNNYGPYQHVEKLIPRAITTLLDGGRPQLYGDGLAIRDWIHVSDHVTALLAILQDGRVGETYLVGAQGERTNRDALDTVLRVLDLPTDSVDYVADRPGHDRRYAIDAAKVRTELGWRPRWTSFEDGMTATVDWYRTHEAWWRPQKAATEARYEAWAAERARSTRPDEEPR